MALCSACGAPYTSAVPTQELCDSCSGLAPAEASPLASATVAGFKLVRQAGAGRFGTSWLGEAPEGWAVVKLLHDFATDGQHVERFLDAAAEASLVRAPNLAGLLTAGALPGGHLFVVYEFGGDDTLADVLRSQARLSPPRALDVCAEVAEGLAALHAQDILHRDLKAANVALWLDEDNSEMARLLDAATAHVVTRAKLRGAAPLPLSSAATTSPEEARGEPVDARADLYALGVILFQALSGRLPVAGGSAAEILRSHREHPPLSLRDAGRKMPDALEATVARLLAKDREQRPSTAREVAQLLRSLVPLVEDEQHPRPPRAPLPPAVVPLPAAAPLLPTERLETPSPSAAVRAGGTALIARRPDPLPPPPVVAGHGFDPDKTPPGGFLQRPGAEHARETPTPPDGLAPASSDMGLDAPTPPEGTPPPPADAPAPNPKTLMTSDFDPDRTPPDPVLATLDQLPAGVPQKTEVLQPRPVPPPPAPPHAHATHVDEAPAPDARTVMKVDESTHPELAAAQRALRERLGQHTEMLAPQNTIPEQSDPPESDPIHDTRPEQPPPPRFPAQPTLYDSRLQAASITHKPKVLRRRRGESSAFSGPGHTRTPLQRQLLKLGIGMVVLLALLVIVAVRSMSDERGSGRRRAVERPAAREAAKPRPAEE